MTNLDEKSLLAAEEARRQAMVANDTTKLAGLLSDTLVYTHTTGDKDSKQDYLGKLSSGALRYEAVEFSDVQARVVGTVGLLTAGMKATVSGGKGNRREVANTYLAVWEHGDAGWVLQLLQGSPLPKPAA
jgi:ketosteroid isomerase-like protein